MVEREEVEKMKELWNLSFDGKAGAEKEMAEANRIMSEEIRDPNKKPLFRNLTEKLIETAKKYNPPENPALN